MNGNGLRIDKFGNKFFYKNWLLHREDGPAVEYADGYKAWYQNGIYHRLDGPAIENSRGDKVWCYQGRDTGCKSQVEFEKFLRKEKLKVFW